MTPPQRDRRTFQCPRQWRSLRRQPAVQNPRPQPWPGAKEQTSRRDVGVFTVLVRRGRLRAASVDVCPYGCLVAFGCLVALLWHGARLRVRYRASGPGLLGEHKSTCLTFTHDQFVAPPLVTMKLIMTSARHCRESTREHELKSKPHIKNSRGQTLMTHSTPSSSSCGFRRHGIAMRVASCLATSG